MPDPLLAPLHELDRQPAVSVGDRALTYRELREAAAALAGRLQGAERVAVWADSSLETCVAVVAALSAGVPLVPINPKLGASELEHVLSDSRPDAVIGGPGATLTADPAERGGTLPDDDFDAERPALIIYTSGTTGRPKGAVLPRRAVASTSTRSPTPGHGPTRTSSPTGCRCSTCTAWCSG